MISCEHTAGNFKKIQTDDHKYDKQMDVVDMVWS
jgi:hypothetical protein